MKAMLLAAGRGSRMRPLTDEFPKPLVPIAGKPFVAHQLLKLATCGIHEIVMNVSYRAEQIKQTLGDGRRYGVQLEYSFEPTVLETGGGICHALPLLGTDPFIVLSADIWTDYPFERLLTHSLGHAQAHLVLVDNPDFHPYGDFHLTYEGLLAMSPQPKFTFANLGLYRPQLFEKAPIEVFPLSKILYSAIAQQKMSGEYYAGPWFNVGTIDQLQHIETYLKKSSLPF